jgi:glycosyltransferase involved in cell wall biosynthesis
LPELTVLLPVYNGAPYLRRAIDGILHQTFADFQLLIINDASTDDSRAIAAAYDDGRITLVDNERNLGLAATLDKGLTLAASELVARHDQDDVSHPSRLQAQIDYLRAHPETVLLGTQGNVIDKDDRYVGGLDVSLDPISIRWSLLFENSFIHPSVMFRRSAIQQVGGYGGFRYCEDYDLWSRVAYAYPAANLPARLVDHRGLETSMTGAPGRLAGMVAESRQVMRRNFQAAFGGRSLSDAELELVSSFWPGLPRASVVPFATLYRQLAGTYARRYPECGLSPDFRRTIGRHYAQMVRSTAGSPMTLARLLRLTPSHDPRALASGHMVRSVSLALFGEPLRQANRRLRSARRWRPVRA